MWVCRTRFSSFIWLQLSFRLSEANAGIHGLPSCETDMRLCSVQQSALPNDDRRLSVGILENEQVHIVPGIGRQMLPVNRDIATAHQHHE